MRIWPKVDLETGMWIEDVPGGDVMLDENGEPDPAYIEEPVPPDARLYWPKRDFATGTWVEGLTPEEIAARQTVPPPVPTQEERNTADIAYLAMMIGVDLDV